MFEDDIFVEEMVVRRKTTLNLLISVGIVALAVALALYSGLCDKVIPEKLMVFGEVGLGGEVRAASHVRERVKEGARLGFERCIIPKQSFSSLSRSENYGIQIIGVRTLEQAFRAINADKEKENKE